jgi:hypothetical protein
MIVNLRSFAGFVSCIYSFHSGFCADVQVQGPGTDNGYSGVKQQGVENGVLVVNFALDAPDQLFYNCV